MIQRGSDTSFTNLCSDSGILELFRRIPVSSTNKTDRHDITEILLKVALNTINLNPKPLYDYILQERIRYTIFFYLFQFNAVNETKGSVHVVITVEMDDSKSS
jgi:hypothetical protein